MAGRTEGLAKDLTQVLSATLRSIGPASAMERDLHPHETSGPDANMVDLRLELAAGCPKIAAGKVSWTSVASSTRPHRALSEHRARALPHQRPARGVGPCFDLTRGMLVLEAFP